VCRLGCPSVLVPCICVLPSIHAVLHSTHLSRLKFTHAVQCLHGFALGFIGFVCSQPAPGGGGGGRCILRLVAVSELV
jgi:hypothetical protein